MGKIDTEAKNYMADNERFADVFNYLVYGGRQAIDPKNLTPLDTTEIVLPYGNETRSPLQKFRDLLKRWQVKTDGQAVYALLGTELESEVNYAMPVKAGLYDFMNYAKQVEAAGKSHREEKLPLKPGEFLSGFRREDRLTPVITTVLYLKDTEWDGPTHLREMFAVTEAQLLSFVPDYRINLLAPHGIPEADFRKFRTDVGPLLAYIKNQKDKNRLDEIMHEDDRCRHMDVETASIINTVTGSRLKFDAKEDKIDMCQAIEEMRQESIEKGIGLGIKQGVEQGIEQGRLESIRNLMVTLKCTAQQAMNFLMIPASDQCRYLAKL